MSTRPPSRRSVSTLSVLLLMAFVPFAVAGADRNSQKRGASKSTRASYEDLARLEKRVPWTPRPVIAGSAEGRLVGVLDGEVFERTTRDADWEARGPLVESGSTVAAPIALALIEPTGWRACLRDGRMVESNGPGDRRVVANLASDAGTKVVVAGLDAEPVWVATDFATSRRGVVLVEANGLWSKVIEVPGTITAACIRDGIWRVVADGTVYEARDGRVTARATLVGANVYGLAFRTADSGWIAADRSSLLESSDGGTQWLPRPLGKNLVFAWVDFATPTHGLALASEAPGGRVRREYLYGSRDAGKTWTLVATGEAPLSTPVMDGTGAFCILDARGTLLVADGSGTAKPAGNIRAKSGAGASRTSDPGKAKTKGAQRQRRTP